MPSLTKTIALLNQRKNHDYLWLSEMRSTLNMVTPKNIRDPDVYIEGLLAYCRALQQFPAEIDARSTRPIARFFASVDEQAAAFFTSNAYNVQGWRLGLQRVCEQLVAKPASREMFANVFIEHKWNPVQLLDYSKKYNQPHGVEPSEAYPTYVCRALCSAIVEHGHRPLDHRTLHAVWDGLLDAGFEINPMLATRQTVQLAKTFPTSINAALKGLYETFLDYTTPAMDTAIANMDSRFLEPSSYPIWVRALAKWHEEGLNAWTVVAKKYPRFEEAMKVHAALGKTTSDVAIEALCTAWKDYAVDTLAPQEPVQLPTLS